MKFYSNTLARADFSTALPEGCYIEEFEQMRAPRVRKAGWSVLIGSLTSKRTFNSGSHGSAGGGAASWDQWGDFLASLFDKDPDMQAGPYKGRADFHAKTHGMYRAKTGRERGKP